MGTELYEVGFYGLHETMDTRLVLAANLCALREKHGALYSSDLKIQKATEKLAEQGMGVRIGRTAVGAMFAGTTPVNLDFVETMARLFGLDAWQLLVPGMDPKHPPVLRSIGPAEEEAYRRIEQARQALANMLGDRPEVTE